MTDREFFNQCFIHVLPSFADATDESTAVGRASMLARHATGEAVRLGSVEATDPTFAVAGQGPAIAPNATGVQRGNLIGTSPIQKAHVVPPVT